MASHQSRDAMEYLGRVAEWLSKCPDIEHPYGSFYVSRVTVTFDGEPIGAFTNDDPDWIFQNE